MRLRRVLPLAARTSALSLALLLGAVGCGPVAEHSSWQVAGPQPVGPGARSTPPGTPASGTDPTRPGVGQSAPTGSPTVGRPGGAAGVMSGPAGSQSRTGTDAVALTFDDGPDPVNTPKLLDLLAAQGVKATFCLVGHRVRDNQEIVKRIAAEGHTLCNHSWQHLEDLAKRPDAYLLRDLVATNEQIHKAVPGAPIKYFRAPYGNFTPRLNGFAAQLGMTPLSWNVDDECWLTSKYGTGGKMTAHMAAMVHKETRKGSIILSHDNLKPQTPVAYQQILPWLKARFTLVPMPVD
jgi:peptidoglycan/xylan/chitin deacetylase (PgdA/CDA1 family)